MAHRRVAVGQQFGKLTVEAEAGHYVSPGGKSLKLWLCRCTCRGSTETTAQRLNGGYTTSCGCVKKSVLGDRSRKHGDAGRSTSAEYVAWCGMKARCYNPRDEFFVDYGGRGIVVTDRWLGENGYTAFLADMGRRPSNRHSIDRIDVDGPYSADNCRWATPAQQSRNTRRNIFVEYGGERMVVKDWARRLGMNSQTIIDRLRRGWSDAQALGKEYHPRQFTKGPAPQVRSGPPARSDYSAAWQNWTPNTAPSGGLEVLPSAAADPATLGRIGSDGKRTPEYAAWSQMKNRCQNTKSPSYPHYGGRGIAVCDRWQNFPAFLQDMGARPSDKHSLDRINANGSYEPGNCRWALKSVQMRNTRRAWLLEHDGETLHVAEWAERRGLVVSCIKERINKGWAVAEALGFETRATYGARSFPGQPQRRPLRRSL